MAKNNRLRYIPAIPVVIELGDFRAGPPREYVAPQVVTGAQMSELQIRRKRRDAIKCSITPSTAAFGGIPKL